MRGVAPLSRRQRMQGSRLKRYLKRFLVLCAATIVACLMAELVVFLIFGEQVKFPRHVVGADFGLRINQPNARYRHKSPDVCVWFRINSNGFRADREYPYEKPEGVKRIVSLGDSFTIEFEVDVEDCFSSVLSRKRATASRSSTPASRATAPPRSACTWSASS